MKIIPRKTKVRTEFMRGITLMDIIVGVIGIAVALALFFSNFAGNLGLWFGIAWITIVVAMYFKVADDMRLYYTLGYILRFLAQRKKYSKNTVKGYTSMKEIIPFEKLYQDRYIDFGEYYAQVIEIDPIEFGLLNQYKQEMLMETFANVLRRLSNEQTASIVKLSKAMILDDYVYNEDKKYDTLLEMQFEGQVTKEEVERRAGVFEQRVSQLEELNRQDKIYKDYFYIVVYDKDREALDATTNGMVITLQNSVTPMTSRKLYGHDLIVFMRANFGKEFDERELEVIPLSKQIDWATPNKIRFQASRVLINDKPYRNFVISDYPLQVPNAWGAPFFLLDRTRVVVKIKPVPKFQAEKSIDKAILEMEAKVYKTARSSKQIENQTHLDTLRELLASLKNNNEQFYNVNTFIMCEEPARKEVRAILKQEGFKFSEMFGRQVDAFISSNISAYDNVKDTVRGIPTTSLAAVFPFISGALQDPGGIYLGYNEYPVFVDFFKRDRERVNSNMMIIGKSGSGKSFATKTLLTNFAADNSKIFILDPENEYTFLCDSLKGKFIDVGSSEMGIFNPFHIMTSLKDDIVDLDEVEDVDAELEKDEVESDSLSQHLQFLEQFFKVILEGISSDAFETLNSLVVELYAEKGITDKTIIKTLEPEDYPIFDDLYDLICRKIDKATDDYQRKNLIIVQTYIKKFSSGGRNSNLWNGPSSITTKENFVCFNFRSLLANNNELIANAQMLLVFKYLNNEIIKNRDFNLKYNTKRKVILAVDEAHVFINPNYPIALDFMQQMAKRIRKYGGMQIVITQNIKDFVGSPEIARQSTAVINASQYSLIFSLAPSDLNDLVELYRKSGEINQEEQNSIVTAGVGQTFLITGPMSRTMVQIVSSDHARKLFGD
ncbi:MAG: ATP-binding protein [Clostridia bacterium]|nr:ATP-binding protein [Clostridia bacterium]